MGAIGVAVTLIGLHDRIWPPVTVRGGEVVAADLVGTESYLRYVRTHPQLFPDWRRTVREAGPLAVRTVAVVDVVLRLQGLRGRGCSVVYTLYRAPLRPLRSGRALARCTGRVQDGDEGGWQAYVLLPRQPGRYVVRFDLYDERGLLLGPGKATRVFAWTGG